MSEQKTAKELANGLRGWVSLCAPLEETKKQAASELDRLADLCAGQEGLIERLRREVKIEADEVAQQLAWGNGVKARIAELEKERKEVAAGIVELEKEREALRGQVQTLASERDMARGTCLSMLRRRDDVANALRCEMQRLTTDRDAVKNELAAAVEQHGRLMTECGKLRDEVARLSRWNAQVCKDRDAARQELVTMTGDRDALAEGVRAYREAVRSGFAFGANSDVAMKAGEGYRAWERKHGHRAADSKPTPPPLLDLRTLPVGTQLEVLAPFKTNLLGLQWKAGDRDPCLVAGIEATHLGIWSAPLNALLRPAAWQKKPQAVDLFGSVRPHARTWAEVEHDAARLLGSEDKSRCTCFECIPENTLWLRSALGITDARDMTSLWAAFREGQKS